MTLLIRLHAPQLSLWDNLVKGLGGGQLEIIQGHSWMCKLEGNLGFESRVLKVGRDIRERHGQGLGPICFLP